MPLLNDLYRQLDFIGGSLYTASDKPLSSHNVIEWIEKGEWLSAAKRIGAEKIFFIDNNPVAVFAECETDHKEKIKAFNNAWCLARPRLLFLASPGEITVYDLAQKPIDINNENSWKDLKHLEILNDLTEVTQKLHIFHRDNIESGKLFTDRRFGDLNNRADKALIRDLKIVRRELIDEGLGGDNIRFAHALIGRSIFIRYLEDRGILTEDYFQKIARRQTGWTDLLHNPVSREGLDFSEHKTYYPRILSDKAFTYALFRNLSQDFNGDMFPEVEEEERVINQRHLKKIQDLLYGDAGIQKKLFFYSYRFDIIPLELISSIYEEFYHKSDVESKEKTRIRQDGAYYTPPVLAEFILSRILTPNILKKNPCILDPACGSGIFLVEAFRRIVRYKWYKIKRPLTFDELKNILKEQISGIEANEDAARITAFSLYLSMLHYLEPPAINSQIKMGNKLPNLLATNKQSANHLNSIMPANAFDVEYIESMPTWQKRFGKECSDIVIGNPPWGSFGKKTDAIAKSRHKILLNWCKSNQKPIGDEEQSQAFLWRALDFLKPDGRAGMLVSAGVLFKHNTTSQEFRRDWFGNVKIDEIFNFSHIRKFFFKEGVAPFLSVFFSKNKKNDKPVYYWSPKQTIIINKTQAVVLTKYDLNIVSQEDILNSSIWKELWFGRQGDKRFLDQMRRHQQLIEYSDRDQSGQGFVIAGKTKKADILQLLNNLVISKFTRYGSLSFTDPPRKVYRSGKETAYSGERLLVKRGIDENTTDKGKIIARYEVESFCFTNAINGVKLKSPEEWKYKTLLGILWSSIARYYFFMTSSIWGLWHHEIHLDDELLQFPVILDKSNQATEKVITIVDKLRNYHPKLRTVLSVSSEPTIEEIEEQRRKWENELDDAVFELYELNEEQKDLIYDFCEVTLPFFYKPFESTGTMQAVRDNDLLWVDNYIHIFCLKWNAYLGNDEEMRGKVHIGAHDNILAVECFVTHKNDPNEKIITDNSWDSILERIEKVLPQSMGISQIIMDGVVHVVSDSGIIIIKRNEKRFWTRSIAREDAEATICKRMGDIQPDVRGTI